MTLHDRNTFSDDKAYEKYLNRMRKKKNYLFYNELITRLIDDGIEIEEALKIVMMIHKERDETNGYHYSWYAHDACECINLIEMELTGKIV